MDSFCSGCLFKNVCIVNSHGREFLLWSRGQVYLLSIYSLQFLSRDANPMSSTCLGSPALSHGTWEAVPSADMLQVIKSFVSDWSLMSSASSHDCGSLNSLQVE